MKKNICFHQAAMRSGFGAPALDATTAHWTTTRLRVEAADPAAAAQRGGAFGASVGSGSSSPPTT